MEKWLIPCSPSIYDAEGAFNEYGSIIWHQQCNMSAGDIAYIYVTAPVKSIHCKCEITTVNLPFDPGHDEGDTLDEAFCLRAYRRYMNLRLMETYDTPCLDYPCLLMNGLNGPIRSQRKVPEQLGQYIERISKENKEHKEYKE